MFWDPPTDHDPSTAERDLRERWQVSPRTRTIAMAMLAALPPPGRQNDYSVYVGIALPGKTHGVWEVGQPVEEAPGFFLATTPDEAVAARDLADAAAGRHLNGRKGTSSYARLTAGEFCAVWEGIHGSQEGLR